jgi:hypothetical protein
VSSHSADLDYLANYMNITFKESIKHSKYFKLADKPGEKTLELKLIIVQVVLNKPIMGTISNISMFTPFGLILAPLKMTGQGLANSNGGAIAVEGIISDSKTGKIYSVFSDRQKGKVALFNSKSFTAFAGIRYIVNRWSGNVVMILDQIKKGEKIHIEPFKGFTFFT